MKIIIITTTVEPLYEMALLCELSDADFMLMAFTNLRLMVNTD